MKHTAPTRTTAYTCQELGVCHGRPGPGCNCQHDAAHDTAALPPAGFYFAPGTIEHGPRRSRSGRCQRAVALLRPWLHIAALLAVVALAAAASGYLHARGWL